MPIARQITRLTNENMRAPMLESTSDTFLLSGALCVHPLIISLHSLTEFPLTAPTLKLCSVSGGSPLFVNVFVEDASQFLFPSTSI